MRQEFDRVWPMLKPAIQRYGDTQRKRHVWQAVESGHAQLWTTENAAIVTTIETYPTGFREIRGWLAGGDIEEIKGMVPGIEQFGKARGCNRATLFGRRGWSRAFDGYSEVAVTLKKDL